MSYSVHLFNPERKQYITDYNLLNMKFGIKSQAELFTKKQAEEIIEYQKHCGLNLLIVDQSAEALK
jgi:hypothetical protein